MRLLPSTQDYLDILDVREDLLILNGPRFRMLIEATAINFDLLSEDEQNATIYAYATLVNSLDAPIQIVIRTRQIDITNYVNFLQNKLRELPTSALREQMEDYIKFIQQLVVENTVLQKRFFVIVPWQTVIVTQTSPSLLFSGKEKTQTKYSEDLLARAKKELNQKFEELKWQFKRLGIQIRKLTTEEIIRLYYEIYNPEAGENEMLDRDVFGYTTGTVTSPLKK